jgi:hypothetical protein
MKLGTISKLLLVAALCPSPVALAQCENNITLVPLDSQGAASKSREFVRFKYSLSSSDSLLLWAHEDKGTTLGPYDTGFSVVRNGRELQRTTLKGLPEMRGEDSDFAESFFSLALARTCGKEGPIFFLTMQYEGDITSPALIFVLVPSDRGYRVSTLPMLSGGVVEVSMNDPTRIKTWDNLHEGACEACETAYEITEYHIEGAEPTCTRRYRSKHLYSSDNAMFDGRRRIRFIP